MTFEVGDEFRFWTRDECAELNGGKGSDYNARKIRTNYFVRIGSVEKEIGPNAAKPLHPTEYELALEVLGEDYFA